MCNRCHEYKAQQYDKHLILNGLVSCADAYWTISIELLESMDAKTWEMSPEACY